MSKSFQMVGFKGSTQEKSGSKIFRFCYGKAANDKKVPDPVGSEILYYIKSCRRGSSSRLTNLLFVGLRVFLSPKMKRVSEDNVAHHSLRMVVGEVDCGVHLEIGRDIPSETDSG
jgi:hypothetical protein